MADDLGNIEEVLNPSEFDEEGRVKPEYYNTAKKAGASLLGVYGTIKAMELGKTGAVRFLDTLGFGNVPGSYKSPDKFSQGLDNIYTAAGKIRKMPAEIIKASLPSGIPIELKAVESSMAILEDKINSFRGAGKKVPKKLLTDLEKHKNLLPDRAMASAIKEKWAGNPINFEYEGKFISNTKPQLYDKDVAKALKKKGFSLKASYPVYDLSKRKTSEMIRYATQDPRMSLINKALKNGNVELAKSYAKDGTIKIGNKLYDTKVPLTLKQKGKGYVVKFQPHRYAGKGKIAPQLDFTFGGHTQRSYFAPHMKGYHRVVTEGFDITSYASAGEKGKGLMHKARILAAGEYPRKLGLHKGAIVSEWRFEHPLGRGKTYGSKSTYKSQRGGKLIAAAENPYIGEVKNPRIDVRILKKATKTKKITTILKALASIASRGKIKI